MGRALLITGASSGIGRATAMALARRSYRLALMARRETLLAQAAREIEAAVPGACVAIRALDVTDPDAVAAAIPWAAETLGGLDAVFANAGIGSGGRVGTGQLAADLRCVQVNLLGAMATLDAALAWFRAHDGGQLIATGSVAGFRGLPGTAAYSASKAGLAAYLEALRAETLAEPIEVTAIYPGFIDTPINQGLRSRPFLIDAADGGERIARHIERRSARAVVPAWPWAVARYLLPLLPTRLLAGRGLR